MIKFVLLLTLFATSVFALRNFKVRGRNNQQRNYARKTASIGDFTELCPCALGALAKMDRIIRKHHVQSVTQPITDVMRDIEAVAHACTQQDECRCPDGYKKSADGFSCFLVSDEEVTCADANTICEEEFGGKLAVAKSEKALMSLANFLQTYRPNSNDFYWIGLSYNTTVGGSPIWKWADGSKADYDVTKGFTNTPPNVKKSLINFSGEDNVPIERVAISKEMEGARWKQEMCGMNYANNKQAQHPYICEYTMFKVQVMSQL